MKIATWNINGVKARIDSAVTWLKEAAPDVACFQEIKCTDEAFPADAFEALGYNVAVHGQKGFNGVAILSKRPLDEVAVRGLPGDAADAHARYIEAVIPRVGGIVRVASLYLPNGNPVGTDKFAYKLAWMRRLEAHARGLLDLEEPFLLMGDFNVIPEPVDAKNPEAWRDDALFQPETRAAYRALAGLGLPDGGRACLPPRARPLHRLGLPGRRLAEGPRHSHRPHPGLAPGRRPDRHGRHRQVHPRLGEALGPRSGLGGTGGRLDPPISGDRSRATFP